MKEIKFNSRQKAVVNGFAAHFAARIVETDDSIIVVRLVDDNVIHEEISGEEIRSSISSGINGDAVRDTPKYREYQIIGHLSVLNIPASSPLWDENVAPSGAKILELEIDISDDTVFPSLWGMNWGNGYYVDQEGFEALQNCGVINPVDRFEDL